MTTYYFTVTASNACGQAANSNEVSATLLTAPTALTAQPCDTHVELSWTAPTTGADTYNVYQGTATGAEGGTPVATGITGTAYEVTGLTNGTAYYFEVSAVKSGQETAKSNEASATPFALAAPTITATPGSSTVTISVPTQSGVTYNIYEGTSPGGETATPVDTFTGDGTTMNRVITV